MRCRYAARKAAKREAGSGDSAGPTADEQPIVHKDVANDQSNGLHPMPKEEV